MMTAQLCNLVLALVVGITVLAEAASVSNICLQPKHDPWCWMATTPMYYYNTETGACEEFGYAPCSFPTRNKFKTLQECQMICQEKTCIDNNGVSHLPGSSFDHEDGCNTCYCGNNGHAFCTLMACVDMTKEKPCIDSKGVSHPSGSSFMHQDGCNSCFCHNGRAGCTKMACIDISKDDVISRHPRSPAEKPVRRRPVSRVPQRIHCAHNWMNCGAGFYLDHLPGNVHRRRPPPGRRGEVAK